MSLSAGIKRLADRNRKLRGKKITLKVNTVERDDVLAQRTKCMVRIQVEGSTGFAPTQLVTDGCDWLISVSDYYVETADDQPVLLKPASGHRFIADGEVYEVLPLGEKDECYYYRDSGRTQYRVHTKQVSE